MKNLVYICFALLMFSCNSAKNNQNMSLNLVSKGDLFGSGNEGLKQQNLVITNKTEWRELVTQMNLANETIKKEEVEKIDFDEKIVIAVFDKQRTTGGHSIEITNLQNEEKTIVLKIKKTHPDGMATTVMTQPYYIASIPKTKKEIQFKEIE